MKKLHLIISCTAILTSVIFIACGSSSKNSKNAQKSALIKTQNLYTVNEKLTAEYRTYNEETASKISDNEKMIIYFKSKFTYMNSEDKASYEQRIIELGKKNNYMKEKMKEFSLEGKENWSDFKSEFNHEMNELENAIRSQAGKNVNKI